MLLKWTREKEGSNIWKAEYEHDHEEAIPVLYMNGERLELAKKDMKCVESKGHSLISAKVNLEDLSDEIENVWLECTNTNYKVSNGKLDSAKRIIFDFDSDEEMPDLEDFDKIIAYNSKTFLEDKTYVYDKKNKMIYLKSEMDPNHITSLAWAIRICKAEGDVVGRLCESKMEFSIF